MLKAILYLIAFPITIWALGGLDLNRFFKQSRVYQARAVYMLVSMSISYLAVNFLYDFFINFQIVK